MATVDIKKLENDLWEAADQLRANSKLTATEYCMPVLGIIFLRHAANRFNAATLQIEEDQASGKMPKRSLIPADYTRRRALWLPDEARYEYLAKLPTDKDLGKAVIDAMVAIEDSFEKLSGMLPKDYGIFERKVLEDLVRIFDREVLRTAGGDVFGRIYEYFLMKFSMQGAQDNGEFFTPPSIVQTIVNVIEPDHGTVFDPACGSGGMFVQSSHFIEKQGEDTAHKVTFYGQEKTTTTIRLANMNLAVHGLEGDIREANTFYQDEHELFEKCDFVMANPPFNVDMVDAEQVKSDRRLPFGLPGENKDKKVPNANYLWISYFYSYLNDGGRAGFVMSSQASSAGNKEKEVREKIVKTGHVDAMIAIRSGFFYTRTVPCELWFFDKGKPEHLRDKVLMLDARNIHRKVTRTVYDFSPEQLANLTSIAWLYRGETERFLGLVKRYFAELCIECGTPEDQLEPTDRCLRVERDLDHVALPAAMETYSASLTAVCDAFGAVREAAIAAPDPADARSALVAPVDELTGEADAFEADKDGLLADVAGYCSKLAADLPNENAAQHAAREAYSPLAERLKALSKNVDALQKMAQKAKDATTTEDFDQVDGVDMRTLNRLVKELDEARQKAVDQLRQARYFHRRIAWLHERFPDALYKDVPGLCKSVSLDQIEQADWSLTPGRYVGVAPEEEDEGFDFEEAVAQIHTELADLNEEAAELAQTIQVNLTGLLA